MVVQEPIKIRDFSASLRARSLKIFLIFQNFICYLNQGVIYVHFVAAVIIWTNFMFAQRFGFKFSTRIISH